MTSKPKHVIITIEAEFPIDETSQVGDLADAIREVIEATRMYGAGRAVKAEFLTTEEDFNEWYKKPGIGEIQIPITSIQEVRFD